MHGKNQYPGHSCHWLGKSHSFQAQFAGYAVVFLKPCCGSRVPQTAAHTSGILGVVRHTMGKGSVLAQGLCFILFPTKERKSLLSHQRPQRFITSCQSLLISSRHPEPTRGHCRALSRKPRKVGWVQGGSWHQVKMKKASWEDSSFLQSTVKVIKEP